MRNKERYVGCSDATDDYRTQGANDAFGLGSTGGDNTTASTRLEVQGDG